MKHINCDKYQLLQITRELWIFTPSYMSLIQIYTRCCNLVAKGAKNMEYIAFNLITIRRSVFEMMHATHTIE